MTKEYVPPMVTEVSGDKAAIHYPAIVTQMEESVRCRRPGAFRRRPYTLSGPSAATEDLARGPIRSIHYAEPGQCRPADGIGETVSQQL